MSTIYCIAGFGESTRMKGYREIIRSAKNNGFKVVSVHIQWNTNVPMSDFIEQTDLQIPDIHRTLSTYRV